MGLDGESLRLRARRGRHLRQGPGAGAKAPRSPEDQFYGDRTCQFEDPWEHRWRIATHVEDVSEEEMARRAEEEMARRAEAETAEG